MSSDDKKPSYMAQEQQKAQLKQQRAQQIAKMQNAAAKAKQAKNPQQQKAKPNNKPEKLYCSFPLTQSDGTREAAAAARRIHNTKPTRDVTALIATDDDEFDSTADDLLKQMSSGKSLIQASPADLKKWKQNLLPAKSMCVATPWVKSTYMFLPIQGPTNTTTTYWFPAFFHNLGGVSLFPEAVIEELGWEALVKIDDEFVSMNYDVQVNPTDRYIEFDPILLFPVEKQEQARKMRQTGQLPGGKYRIVKFYLTNIRYAILGGADGSACGFGFGF